MTEREKATCYETLLHIRNVQRVLGYLVAELVRRAEAHDSSKLQEPELSAFVEFTPKLSGCTYASEKYHSYTAAMRPALAHHYANNRHHPEHFENGINGMNLLDLVEMLADWKAATLRHHDGDINRSIEINAGRFGMAPQLQEILRNTLPLLDGREWNEVPDAR